MRSQNSLNLCFALAYLIRARIHSFLVVVFQREWTSASSQTNHDSKKIHDSIDYTTRIEKLINMYNKYKYDSIHKVFRKRIIDILTINCWRQIVYMANLAGKVSNGDWREYSRRVLWPKSR